MEDTSQSKKGSIAHSFKQITSLFSRSKSSSSPALLDVELQAVSSTFGIEDVDHTWVFGVDGYNTEKSESFKRAGIFNHFLCSDMMFEDREIDTREKLKEHMQQDGHKVFAILTTSDLAWHLNPGVLKEFFETCIAKANIDFLKKRNLDKIPGLLALPQFYSIKEFLEKNPVPTNPGIAYECVFRDRTLRERAIHAKWVANFLVEGYGTEKTLEDGTVSKRITRKGIKGLLVRPLLLNPPDGATDFIFFDDKKDEVHDVTFESACGEATKTRISAFVCPFKTLEDCKQSYYDQCISNHRGIVVKREPTPPPTQGFFASSRPNSNATSATVSPADSRSGSGSDKETSSSSNTPVGMFHHRKPKSGSHKERKKTPIDKDSIKPRHESLPETSMK